MPRTTVNLSAQAETQMKLLQKILAKKLGGNSITSGFALSVALQRTFENLDSLEEQILKELKEMEDK